MATIRVRVPDVLLVDIDERAAGLGVTRSELVRRLIVGNPTPEPGQPSSNGAINVAAVGNPTPGGAASLAETLELLSTKARAGVVTAQVALLRHLAVREPDETAGSPPDDPLAELDELARRRPPDQGPGVA